MKSHAKFSCCIVGTGTLPIQCAEMLLQAGHEIVGIISDDRALAEWTDGKRLVHLKPGVELEESLSLTPFDYLFSIVNEHILADDILALPRKLAINYHDGPLPRYAGTHATSWALLNRETTHGMTWHVASKQVDAGDILKQRRIEIEPNETAFTLNTKCYEAAIQSFAALVGELASGQASRITQDLRERSFFPRYQRPPAGCLIAWERSADEIAALVRALDFGPHPNPLGVAKFAVGDDFIIPRDVRILDSASGKPPGTITFIEGDHFVVSTASRDLALRSLSTLDGRPLATAEFIGRHGLTEGDRLDTPDEPTRNSIETLYAECCRHEAFWVERLSAPQPLVLPYATSGATSRAGSPARGLAVALPQEVRTFLASHQTNEGIGDVVLAAWTAYLGRISGLSCFDVGFSDSSLRRKFAGLENLFAWPVPLRIEMADEQNFAGIVSGLQTELKEVRRRLTYPLDVLVRYPVLHSKGESAPSVAVEIVDALPVSAELGRQDLRLAIRQDGAECSWLYNPDVFAGENVERMMRQFGCFLQGLAAEPERSLGRQPLMSDEELHRILVEWNDTAIEYPKGVCVHELFEAQVERTPEAIAAVWEEHILTYRELNQRANKLAHHLREQGVGPESLVGICVERSLEMLVGILGILKAGGAYVPLDPRYPAERLAFITADATMLIIVTQQRLAGSLPRSGCKTVCLDEAFTEGLAAAGNFPSGVSADNLAYVLYTSGSTGKPKGVMVTHRNVVNFFAGMDERIGKQAGVLLAVTSISFDISVLELLWTLARGFKVVLHVEQTGAAQTGFQVETGTKARQAMDFSLFYFSADEGEDPAHKYRLLIEGAKFADQHGFAAVWTPERHFHPFGALYPNPAVIGAALAAITNRVQIRAGSVVLPLHQPLRVAEEWSVVDNLSRGRVGVSFASGWHPQDFALAPANFAARKSILFDQIQTFRKLWRGESIDLRGGDGKEVAVRIFPTPIQRDVPVWVTAASHPDTFRKAGELGFNVLTHLLGQSLDQVAEKIRVYREACDSSGHGPRRGQVTLMLHTFIGKDEAQVRREVRTPFMRYLASSVDLISNSPEFFPALNPSSKAVASSLDTGLHGLRPQDKENLLDVAFERYFATSGLFGTPDDCLKILQRVQDIGVDEVACLIDFGVGFAPVMESLELLDSTRQRFQSAASSVAPDYSIPALIRRHQVTHLQCTPSRARMLAADPEALKSLRALDRLMLGGEALPSSLLETLRSVVKGEIHNMYGPTETTVWSSTHQCAGNEDSISIGRPIANTTFYVTDKNLQLLPSGLAGELLIGGLGVARGYWNRPELTAEKFIPNPFDSKSPSRLYRTGDLVRYRPDGEIEFLGRLDHQIKLRGHRIELGEIETILGRHPAVAAVTVSVYQDENSDQKLVAYYVPKPSLGQHPGNNHSNGSLNHVRGNTHDLRGYLEPRLPEYMIPASFVTLDALPLTPNGKIDRRALPAPARSSFSVEEDSVRPRDATEQRLVQIWEDVLGIRPIGVRDNFFRLGGDSLLTVRVLMEIEKAFGQAVAAPTFFQVSTIEKLAALLRRDGNSGNGSGEEDRHDPIQLSQDSSRIRLLAPEDLDTLADIHIERFPDSRSTQLGKGYLKKMYHWFLTEYPQLAVVATFDNRVVGFTVGSVGGYGRRVFRHCLLEIMHGMLLRPRLVVRSGMFTDWRSYLRAFLPKAWRKSKSLRGSAHGPEVSNASLAVTNLAPGNTGISLLLAFENAARQQGAALLRGTARPDNIRAREVFEGLGWEAYAQTPTKVSYVKHLT